MHLLEREDLRYHDYHWHLGLDEDVEQALMDREQFRRERGYEVLDLLNGLTGVGGSDLPLKTRLVCEWLIHEKLPSEIQVRSKVIDWLAQHFGTLLAEYPG